MNSSDKPSKETLKEWHDDPSNWIWWVFYYNKKDKRIFPPKRLYYLGWTVNFANPYSYITLIGIVLLCWLIVHFLFK